jgi:hypothetical protein
VERTLQGVGLLRQRLQFDLDSQFHSPSLYVHANIYNKNMTLRAFLPRLKAMGFLPFPL